MERTLRLIQRAHEGDKEARDILVEENVGLVWSIVRRFQNRGVESEDLFQIGTIGLIRSEEHTLNSSHLARSRMPSSA